MSPRWKEEPPGRISGRAFRALLGWVYPFRWGILLNVALTLLLTGIELSVPQVLKWTIDGLVASAAAVEAAASEAERAALRAQTWRETLTMLGVFVGLFAVGGVIHYFEVRRIVALAQRFMVGMRERFFAHLHALSMRYYNRMKAGQLIARGTSDMEALEEMVSWAPSQMVHASLMIGGAILLMLREDPVLFLAVLPLLAVLAGATFWFQGRAGTTWRRVRQQSGRLTANLAESIAGARVIQAFAREGKALEDFDELADGLYATHVETVRIVGRYRIAIRVLATASTAVVILFGGWRMAHHGLSPGAVAAFLGYIALLFRPLEHISMLYNTVLHALAGAERVLEVLDVTPEIVDRPGAVTPEDMRGEVAFEDVTFGYDEGTDVLRNLSFRVRPGERIALVGPTGAGKTTICRLIARFYETSTGVVRIDGSDVCDLTQQGLHRHMGIVLQENFLFNGTVLDNIRYGRPDATDDEVIACAQREGSHRAIAALPDAFRTEVGERGGALSAGQRQLICYTRALLADPTILILDEATSSVDTVTELAIQRALERLTERRTCFIVAHRLSTIRSADRVLVIEDGGISEQGTHDELVAAGGRYAGMYEEFIRAE